MTSELHSRRFFLNLMVPAVAGLVAIAVAPSIAAKGTACSDPEAESDEGLRKSMNYQPIAGDGAKSCLKCTFYTAEGAEGCGRCQIFSGIVNVDGSCDAWSI